MDNEPIINGPFTIERLSDAVIPARVQFSVDLASYMGALNALLCSPVEQRYKATLDFHRQQNALFAILSGLDGDLFWGNVMEKMFKPEPFDDASLSDNLQRWLDDGHSSSLPSTMPYALMLMQTYFIELVKNSIDAKIKDTLERPSPTPRVELCISCQKHDNNTLSLEVSDNGPGFHRDYIAKFDRMKRDHHYSEAHASREKIESAYFLGGAGKGLRGLMALCLDGVALDNRDGIKLYDVPPGATDITIATRAEGGAMLTVTTPIAPITQHTFRPPMMADSLIEEDELLTPLSLETEENQSPYENALDSMDEAELLGRPRLSIEVADENDGDKEAEEEIEPPRPFRP